MIENNIQVNPDTTGKGNFITQEKGKHKGELFVRGGVEGQAPSDVKAVFPTSKIGTTFPQRKNAADLFLEYVQQPIEEKLKEIQNRPINNLLNKTSKLRTADLAAQTATGIATGNPLQAGAAGTTLATTQVLQNPKVQKRVAKQIAELTAKRGAKSAAKLIPGVDILISSKETWDYLQQGKLDQAGIAAVSGLIGWIPVIGDGASAALDLTNTGNDISRLDLNQRKKQSNIDNVKSKPGGRKVTKALTKIL